MTTAYKKSNRSRANLLPCARPGCDEKRVPGHPYCLEHKRQSASAYNRRNRDIINAKQNAKNRERAALLHRLQAERDTLAGLLRRWHEYFYEYEQVSGAADLLIDETDAALAGTVGEGETNG